MNNRLDRLRAMELFARVVETGSFARAAESLGMPSTSATNLIQQLEASLGVRLVNRTTRRLSVTPDGAAYYESCRDILDQVREVEESLGHRQRAPRGRIRVELPTLMARLVIVPALPAFFARYPEIEVSLGCSERRSDLTEDGIDCAIWSGDLADSTLVARRIGQLYYAVCAAPAYLAAHGRPKHPLDLTAHRCINRVASGNAAVAEWTFAKDDERIQVALSGHIAVDDENSYVAAAEAGLGIARMPAFVVKEGLEAGRLEIVLGDWFPEPMPLSIVYPQRRHLSAKVRVFVDWVGELFAAHDGIQLRSTLYGKSAADPD